MSVDPGKETRLVPINGRQVVVKSPTDAQIMLLGQQSQIVMNERASGADRMNAVGTIMTVMTKLIVQDDDRAYVQEQIISGDLDMAGMTKIVEAFRSTDKKPAVTRARASRR